MSSPTILLGKGTYGGVYKTAAVGVYKSLKNETLSHTVREIICAMGLTHPNTVKAYEVSYDAVNTRIRLKEFTGDIYSWSNEATSKLNLSTLPFCLRICYGMVAGVYHIHSARMLHADIKPQNVLINGLTGDVAYCDYNFCSLYIADSDLPTNIQTPNYRAPEVDIHSIHRRGDPAPYDQSIDIWSLGAMIYWLFTGHQILPNDTPDDTTISFSAWLGLDKSGGRKDRLSRIRGLSRDAVKATVCRRLRNRIRTLIPGGIRTKFFDRVGDLIAACIMGDPKERPQPAQLYELFLRTAKVFYGDKTGIVFRNETSHAYSGLGDGLPSVYVLCSGFEFIEDWPGCVQNAFGRLFDYAYSQIMSREQPVYRVDSTVVPPLTVDNIQRACMYVVCSMYMTDSALLNSVVPKDTQLLVLRVLELVGYNVLHLLV